MEAPRTVYLNEKAVAAYQEMTSKFQQGAKELLSTKLAFSVTRLIIGPDGKGSIDFNGFGDEYQAKASKVLPKRVWAFLREETEGEKRIVLFAINHLRAPAQ